MLEIWQFKLFSNLVFLVIVSVEHHGLEPVTPQDLVGDVGGSSLEGQSGRFDGSLHRNVKLEVSGGQVGGAHPVMENIIYF